MSTNIQKQEIEEKVNLGLAILFQRDLFLLKYDINENSISHKLAEYLQILFPDWNVDFDYNKDTTNKKILIQNER